MTNSGDTSNTCMSHEAARDITFQKFDQDSYTAHLKENSVEFNEPFFLKAEDNDENETENAIIRFKIVGGNLDGNFRY